VDMNSAIVGFSRDWMWRCRQPNCAEVSRGACAQEGFAPRGEILATAKAPDLERSCSEPHTPSSWISVSAPSELARCCHTWLMSQLLHTLLEELVLAAEVACSARALSLGRVLCSALLQPSFA
jgi:hypothetical protein